METSERFEDIEMWYRSYLVQYRIIRYAFNREFSALIPSWITDAEYRKMSCRHLRCHNIDHFQFLILRGLGMFEKHKPYNLYYSIARYRDGVPYRNLSTWDIDKSWIINNHLYVDEYDCFIDIDAGKHDDIGFAHYSAKYIMDTFNLFNIPYELRFSGMGFHLIIPYKYFAHLNLSFNPVDENSIYSLYASIGRMLFDTHSELVDLNIYDSRRLCKIPFSLALYENNIYVCYPFDSINKFNAFDLKDYELANFNKGEVRLNKRKVFNGEGSIKELLLMLKKKVVKDGRKKKAITD